MEYHEELELELLLEDSSMQYYEELELEYAPTLGEIPGVFFVKDLFGNPYVIINAPAEEEAWRLEVEEGYWYEWGENMIRCADDEFYEDDEECREMRWK